jgi:hypothetical protein
MPRTMEKRLRKYCDFERKSLKILASPNAELE